ncbi:MAG: hypothetical protein L3J24_09770 [Xanthomonadales bacterium]|nr:hypothetical protein [Xanthomonadales bacterium]
MPEKPDKPNKLSSDLRGAKSLAVDAVTGVSGIVESLHQTIVSFAGLLGKSGTQRTQGLTGGVYKSINLITELVGSGLDVLLLQLDKVLADKTASTRKREAVLAAVNGVLGDHLHATNNPLQIPMQFRIDGKAFNQQTLNQAIEKADGKLLILVHGSCMNDLQWHRQDRDHGEALADELGYARLYLHYNSGLHISENGSKFADLLDELLSDTPENTKLTLLAHSMGGLVSRSACHYAEDSGYRWITQLDSIIFLGTPHHGAPLEKGVNLIDHILEINAYSKPFSRLLQIRSSGMTDLRYGNLLAHDWEQQNRFKLQGDQRTPLPLPKGVACYAIAATTDETGGKPVSDHLIGDGLVTVSSALGEHKNPALKLNIPQSNQWIGRKMDHWDLLNHSEVYAKLKGWLTAAG